MSDAKWISTPSSNATSARGAAVAGYEREKTVATGTPGSTASQTPVCTLSGLEKVLELTQSKCPFYR